MKKLLLIAVVLVSVLAMSAPVFAQTNVSADWISGDLVFKDKSGNIIGRFDGTNRQFEIPSGSVIDIESGGALKISGTAVSASAAQLNKTAVTTAGTVEASKVIVVDANKHIDTLGISASGLKIGTSGSETVVTSTAAELNLNDDLPASFSFTPAAGGSNVSEVTIQAKDAAGTNMARAVLFLVYLSDASTGVGLTGTTASGTVTAKAASGTDFGAITAKKAILVQSKADGTFILEITDTAKTGFYVCAVPLRGGAPSVSAQLVAGNYGS